MVGEEICGRSDRSRGDRHRGDRHRNEQYKANDGGTVYQYSWRLAEFVQ